MKLVQGNQKIVMRKSLWIHSQRSFLENPMLATNKELKFILSIARHPL